jgi:hypothetical protein
MSAAISIPWWFFPQRGPNSELTTPASRSPLVGRHRERLRLRGSGAAGPRARRCSLARDHARVPQDVEDAFLVEHAAVVVLLEDVRQLPVPVEFPEILASSGGALQNLPGDLLRGLAAGREKEDRRRDSPRAHTPL